ncbi:MAG: class I SAM-dependent methyltransferase [Chitinophagia bacterium]|nr:class I SAM-dependent methyltransferase [Chitinophagia bacterium]
MLKKLVRFVKRKVSSRYKFNEQFASGKWDELRGVQELARYSVIAGYVQHYNKSARILDLGCGEGILQERLSLLPYQSYLGIDFSDVAIARAKRLENSNTHFITGDIGKLVLNGSYDVIIYNESIYYINGIPEALYALFPHLAPGGYVIISVVDKKGRIQTDIWNKVRKVILPIESTQVFNRLGHSWTIQVYQGWH